MIKEIYVKGKYEGDMGAGAYVVVCGDRLVTQGFGRFSGMFTLDGRQFPCDQFNCEILAAVCGMARCYDDKLVNVYSNNKSVIAWLRRGGEPETRTSLLGCYRKRAEGKDVFVDYIPRIDKDPSGNKWNELCDRLATDALCGD